MKLDQYFNTESFRKSLRKLVRMKKLYENQQNINNNYFKLKYFHKNMIFKLICFNYLKQSSACR